MYPPYYCAAEWLSFYEKSLKDAVLTDVMAQMELMENGVQQLAEQWEAEQALEQKIDELEDEVAAEVKRPP